MTETPRRLVRVNLARLELLHPAYGELVAIRRRVAEVERGGPAWGTIPPLSAPVPPGTIPSPPLSPEPIPHREVNRDRAAAAIRADYAERRRAVALPEPAAPPPAPAPVASPRPPELSPSREMTSGLEPELARLQRQLDQLRETPQDRVLFAPAQLRRRRELYAVTRGDLERVRRDHLTKLRAALAPGAAVTGERPPRPPRATPAPEPPPPRFPALDAAEARELDALPRGPALPAPLRPAAHPPLENPHEGDRARFTHRRSPLPSGTLPTPQALLPAWRRRAEALEIALRENVRAAAVAAGSEAGLQVVFDRPAQDATAQLLPRIRRLLQAGSLKQGRPK